MRAADSQATRLLARVLATGNVGVDRIAQVLVTDERTIGLYLSGELAIPTDRQLCLARFLIDEVPAMSRQGHNLLGRVQARIRFDTGDTVVHNAAPPSHFG